MFLPAAIAEAHAARPVMPDGREDSRDVPFVTIDPPDAKDHDYSLHARPTPTRAIRRAHRPVAIADVAHYALPARRSTVLRSSAVIRFISPTGSCRCCRSASQTTCPRSARWKTGRRWRCGWSSAPTAAVARTFPSRHDPPCGAAARRAGAAAFSGGTDEVTEPLVEHSSGRSPPPIAPGGRPQRAWPARSRTSRAQGPAQSDGTVDRVIIPQRLELHRLIEEFMILATPRRRKPANGRGYR